MSLIREPIVVSNLVKALLVFLTSFGVVISVDQQEAVLGLVAAVIAVAAVLLPVALERNAVTPVAAPRIPIDALVEVYNDTGETMYSTRV